MIMQAQRKLLYADIGPLSLNRQHQVSTPPISDNKVEYAQLQTCRDTGNFKIHPMITENPGNN
jgi:hypothetical protein